MITNFKDHAANERTYLAWIRTGVTIMMLGFFIEKFEIFLVTLTSNTPSTTALLAHKLYSSHVSIALVALAILIIGIATLRYYKIKHELDAEEILPFRGTIFATAVSVLMLAFGIYLLANMGGMF